MELSSSGPPERLNNLNKGELSPQRDKDVNNLPKTPEPSDTQEQMVQRCVIIQKDEKGYGLTVSGDNPVFVQSVKEDGAAARAGVQEGDRIIKVNGTLVTQSNHQEVVKLIKSGSYVALTLLGKPPGQPRTLYTTLQPLNISGINISPHATLSNKLTSPSERITPPQPVDPEKQQQLTNSRIHTIRKMLEKELVYLENLKSEFSKTPSEKVQAEVNGCTKRVKTLEEQLMNLTGLTHEQIIPKSPKPTSHLRHCHSEKENRHVISSSSFVHQGRPLTHQVSAPVLPPKPDHFSVPHAKATDACDLNSPSDATNQQPSAPPFEALSSFRKPSLSLENFQKQLSSRSTTWPQVGPMHSRQSSSPEGLIKHVESMRHQRNPRNSESLCRSHSEASQHFHKSPVADASKFEPNTLPKTSSSSKASLGQYDSTTESPLPSPHGSPEISGVHCDTTDLLEADDPAHDEFQTPPETSSAEVNMHSVINKLGQNTSIICMEEEDFSSDTEVGHMEDHGPFNGLWKLVRNNAHLAVFMHYLMSHNSDTKCSSLFFYLITDLYEQGNGKEMKKWAYEIHSSFLLPGAPLKLTNVDETILHEIDEVLLHQIEKEEVLRTVFRKARKKAREELNDLLEEFRNKRTMGLAYMFSPPDYQLEEAMNDKLKETKIIEQYLLPYLENVTEDLECMSDLHAARSIALVTMLKQFGIKAQQGAFNWSERCPTFVSKDQSRVWFLRRNKKVVLAQEHQFVEHHYYSVTYCNHCQLIIWGVGNQGYQCQNCQMNIHKMCVKVVEEHCIGSLRNKNKRAEKKERKDRKSGIYRGMENIINKTRKPSQTVPSAIEKARKLNEEMNQDDMNHHNDAAHENSHESGDKRDSKSEQKINNDPASLHLQDFNRTHFSGGGKKNSGIGRSESFRQRRESRPSFRKRSDPNIPRSKSDVEVDDKSASNLNNSGSSSNSSLSNRSLDSSLAEMVHRTSTITSTDSTSPYNTSTNVPSPLANVPSTIHNYDDSDLDADADPPNWQENLDADVLQSMKPKDKKRQDVINELFHTEKTHVRNLKVLDRIFYKPLCQEQLLPFDMMQLLFPNLEEMIEIHSCFNNKIKARRREESIVGDIGSLMLEMFDCVAGDNLKKAAATFCQNHSIALENLKMRQKKDQKLAQFLADAEVHNLCRRLQLKDIIASGFQRLTKYPLLLENIAKYTASNTQEVSNLLRAVECSKDILVHVDAAVKEAENLHRLSDIQRRLEKGAFEKTEHAIVTSYKNLDVTKRKLVYEGPLTWRLNKQKVIEMHALLLEDILVLLQKQDERYILKFHNTNLTTSKEDTKIMHSPILPVENLLVRDNATDKRSIFLISSSQLHAMYEFVAATASEKKIWCRYLSQTVGVKSQTGSANRQLDLPQVVSDFTPTENTHVDDVTSLNKWNQNKDSPAKVLGDSVESVEPPSSNSPSTETPQTTNVNDSNEIETKELNTSVKPDSTESQSEADSRSQRRPQLIEIRKTVNEPQLIEPSEVIISEGAVLQTAEPVLTPIERLKRKDLEIAVAIQEKEKLVGDFLQISSEDILCVAELDESNEDKNARELVLDAIHQGNQLSLILSETLNTAGEESDLEEEDESPSGDTDHHRSPSISSTKSIKLPVILADRLLSVSVSLNKKLTDIMAAVNGSEEERRQLRKELVNAQEQVHFLKDSHQQYVVRSQSPSNYSACHSRPNSFLSVTSSMSEEGLEVVDEQTSTVLNVVTEETTIDVGTQDSCCNNLSFNHTFSYNQSSFESTMCNNITNDVPSAEDVVSDTSCSDVTVQPVTDLDCDSPTNQEAESANSNTESSFTSDSNCVTQTHETSVDSIYF